MSLVGPRGDAGGPAAPHTSPAPPPGGTDWERLLRDFLGSDARAARASADAFCGVIQGTLRALGAYGRRSSWEDLMHDVLLALFQHGHSVQRPAAWLRRATLNAYIDWLRKESSRNACVSAFTHAQSMQRGDSADVLVEAQAMTREELEELRQAIAKLPDELRSIVEKVYPADPARELSCLADVAGDLGIELHTVKNRLRRALETLGRELRRERNLRRFRVPREPLASARARRSRATQRGLVVRMSHYRRSAREPRTEE